MAAALAVAAIIAFGAASPTQALAAADDGSATTTADIVLVAPGANTDDSGNDSGDGSDGGSDSSGGSGSDSDSDSESGSESDSDSDPGSDSGSDSGSGSGSAGTPGKAGSARAASPITGDSIAWGSLLALAALAAGVALFARRQAAVGANSGTSTARPAHGASRAKGRPSVSHRSAASSRPSAYSRPSAHARMGSHAKRSAVNWGRIGVVALAVALVALVASSVMVFSARADGNDTIRIDMQKAADGTYSGTTTYYLNNDATYYRQLVKVTEAANAGYSISDGSITITITPASDPSDIIVSPDAVEGAATSGGIAWRMPGSAVSDDHVLALKVTATAKTLQTGNNEVGAATFDMTAPSYENLKVRLSAAPVVGEPLTASVFGAPEEAANTFTYAWLCSDDDGETWKEIPGAAASTYTPTPDMAGKRISVSLACANPAWFVVSPADYDSAAPTCPAAAEGQHIVQFDVGDHGSAPAAQVVDDGANAQRPADPTETGYTFGGWFADAECTQEFSFTTPIIEDTTLYALWIPGAVGTYTVVHLQQSLDDLATYAEVDRDVKTGEFSGELADIARTYAGFTAVRFERDTAATGGLVLNVYYDRKSYTVTFHANGSVYDTAAVLYGTQATAPATNPTATGKDFSCWIKTEGSDAAYDFAAPVTGDLDLYARFVAQMFTVTFETWGQQPKPDDQQVEYGDAATEPASPVIGQGSPEFKGWYADDAYLTPFDFTASIMQDTTVYAKYSPNVLVDFQGKAKNVSFPKAYDSTFAESELAGVNAPGYDIVDDKWYQDAEFNAKWTFPIGIDGDKVIYPKLSARTDTPYKVEHYQADLTGGGYTLVDTDSLQGITATDTAAVAKAYDGFTSEGTAKGGDGTIEQKAIAGDGGTVIELYYKRNTDTPYTVQHWLQNAGDDDYTHDTGADQALRGTTGAVTAAVAKTYTGFTAQAITQGTIAGDGTTVVKVYYDRATYTVTYDVKGHGDTPDPVTDVRHGSTLSNMPAPTATGYTFEGWHKDANCTDAWNAGSDMVTGDITLYAKWEGRPYKIAFNANSAPEGSTQTMADIPTKVGQSTTLMENAFTREGWTFAGWDTEADGTGTHYDDKASSSTFSEDGTDVVLYAQWIGKSGIGYKVEHYLEDGYGVGTYTLKETDDLTGTAGTDTAAAAKATADYDDFVCSGTTQDGDGTIEQQAIKGDGTTVVKVYYKQGACKVTFQAWGQAVSGDNPQRVAHGGNATQPATPAESSGNPTFLGWYTDPSFPDGAKFDFTTDITSDITLYGKFSPRVNVVFVTADGAQVGASSIPLTATGGSATLTQNELDAVVIPAGYTLVGSDYYNEQACTTTVSVPKSGITDDSVTIYGKVTANTDTKYKVEHYQQSLSDEGSYQLVATDEKEGTTGAYTEAAANTPDGFALEGTTKGGDGAIEQKVIAGDGSTVVAIYYKRNTVGYTVEHYQQDLTGSGYTKVVADDETKSAKTGATTEAAANTYTGFEVKAFSQETVAGDGTTVVKIYYDRETFTVTFHEQGHGTAPDTQTVRYGGTATKPADPTETGYDFGGWFQEVGCTNAFDFTQTITENKNAYAKWTIQQFVVSFIVSEVMANKPDDQTVDYGGKATEPAETIAKTGYHLIGWFKDAGYTTAFDFAAELIKATTSVYGHFALDTYDVTYDGNSPNNDVSDLPSTQTKEYGKNLTLSSKEPTRQSTPSGTKYTVYFGGNGGSVSPASAVASAISSYTFKGWNTSADGSGTSYDPGASYTQNAGTTLYAQWDSESSIESVTLPTPTRNNYVFRGWFTNTSGGTKVGNAGASYTPTSGSTYLYAQWESVNNAYTINYNFGDATNNGGINGYAGSGTMEKQYVIPTDGYTIKACEFEAPTSSTEIPLKFIGWNTKADGTGRWVLPEETIAPSATTSAVHQNIFGTGKTVTLYAQWSHLAGLTAAELAEDSAFDTYKDYVGDVWIPVTESGNLTSYDKLHDISDLGYTYYDTSEVSQVLICTLIGAGFGTTGDGANMLTFASRALPMWDTTNPQSSDTSWQKVGAKWGESRIRTLLNDESGDLYKALPSTLTADGVVKQVSKKYRYPTSSSVGSSSTSDKFWVLSPYEARSNTSSGSNDGPQYSVFTNNNARASVFTSLNAAAYLTNPPRNLCRSWYNSGDYRWPGFNVAGSGVSVFETDRYYNNDRYVSPCFCL